MPTLLDKMKLPPFLKSFTVNATSTDQSDDSNKSSVVSKSPKSFSLVSTPVVNKKPVRPNYSATLRTASYLSDHSACTNSSTDTWPALPVHDSMPVRPKLPTFLRSTSYRSDHSCSSRTTSRSRDIEKGIPQLNDCLEPILLPTLDTDSAIYAPVSPSLDSGDEGLAFEDLASPSLRVVIVGTGFAGLTAAIACARQGFSVTVLERSSGRSAHGDSVLLGANATLLMHKWGIGEEMWKRASRGSYWILYDKQGREVHKEDLRAVAEKYGAPILQGKRSHFIGVLGTEARLLGVKIRYETEVTGYSDSSESPAVILAGGEIVRADVVIVCDGARSVSRTLLAEANIPPTPRRPSGYSIYRAIINAGPIREDPICRHFLDGCIRFWLGLDSHVEIWPMDNGQQLAFTFTHPDVSHSSSLSWRSVSSISAVLAELCDWDPVLQSCIKKFPKALNWTILEDSIHTGWRSKGGKIVFAGDAVHPLSPASFQGATQACEDGATIAQCLSLAGASPKSVHLALRAFELLRKERTEKAGRLGRKQQRIFHTFVDRASGSPQPLDPSASPNSADFTPQPDILRPLAFQLFDFDSEKFAQDNFHKVVDHIKRERLANANLTGEPITSHYFNSEGDCKENGISV